MGTPASSKASCNKADRFGLLAAGSKRGSGPRDGLGNDDVMPAAADDALAMPALFSGKTSALAAAALTEAAEAQAAT